MKQWTTKRIVQDKTIGRLCVYIALLKDGTLGKQSLSMFDRSASVSSHLLCCCESVLGSNSPFWFCNMSTLPYSSSRWWLMMFADLWRGADRKNGKASLQKIQLNLSCPCLRCLGYDEVVKWSSLRWVWKAMLNSIFRQTLKVSHLSLWALSRELCRAHCILNLLSYWLL